MPGMDGFINFNGTLEGSIAGGGGGDVTDVKVRDSQETTFESVVNEEGVAEIDLISYVRRNELTQAIENVENSIDNVEELVDTKQNVINYSTEEQNTGRKWIDGKQLYERTINCGELTSGTHNIETLTVEEVKFIKGFVEDINDSSYIRPLPFAADSSNSIRVDISNNVLRIITYAPWSGYRAYLTIQYTKNSE